jgi:hypothetical protein
MMSSINRIQSAKLSSFDSAMVASMECADDRLTP